MRTNTKQFVLLLLATTVSSLKVCQSFQEVALFNTKSFVLSAPGFVNKVAIPKASPPFGFTPKRYENATGSVTQYAKKTVAMPRYLDFNKTITVRLPGTGDWAGYNESIYENVKDVDFDGFLRYFTDGGAGLVFELENHSTFEMEIESGGNLTTYTAGPTQLFKYGSKVALAFLYEVEMTIAISSANVLSFSIEKDTVPGDKDNYIWFALQDVANGPEGVDGVFMVQPDSEMTLGPNQCLAVTTTRNVPTSSPTQPTSGSIARGSGGFLTTAFATLAAAAMVALW